MWALHLNVWLEAAGLLFFWTYLQWPHFPLLLWALVPSILSWVKVRLRSALSSSPGCYICLSVSLPLPCFFPGSRFWIMIFCLDVSYSYFSTFISYLTVHGMKTQVCVCRDWSEGKVPGPARDKLQKWAGKREGPQDPKMFNYSIREALLCTIPTPFSSSFSLRTFSLRTSTSSSQGQGLNVADREGHSQVEHHPREVFYNSFHFLFYDKLWEIERVSRRRH